MRNLLSVMFCLTFSYFAVGQQNTFSSITGNEHMEVRFLPIQGLSYRLAPNLPFQKAGLFNRKLKPYFNEYDESLVYHKKYNRNNLGIVGGGLIYSVGFGTALYGVFYNSPNEVRIGGASAIVGIGLQFWFTHRKTFNMRKAVDSYNRNKKPSLEKTEYLEASPNLMNMWKFRTNPSEEYKSIGVYGRKIRPYFQEDEDAFDAFKKYKAAHITRSLSNITMLVGSGMIITGIVTDDNDLSRNGLITSTSGVVVAMIGGNLMNKYFYQAIDLINYRNSPFLNSSLMPSLQPSSHSVGLGLVWKIE